MLDRYHFEQELGAGIRGVVYRGWAKDTGRVAAIKLIADATAGVYAGHVETTLSLMITLYRLACGRLPFGGRSRPEIAQHVRASRRRDEGPEDRGRGRGSGLGAA